MPVSPNSTIHIANSQVLPFGGMGTAFIENQRTGFLASGLRSVLMLPPR